jgi:hypothetical protein
MPATRADLDMGVEADENGGEADQAVHDRNKLGHLGHLHPRGELVAHRRRAAIRISDSSHRPEPGPISVATTASAMPTMPYQTARLALSWPDRPPSERMKRTPRPRRPQW